MSMSLPTEQTPLVQTVIITRREPRYSHGTLRRFCTVALAFTLAVVIILFLIPVRWFHGKGNETEWSPGARYHWHAPWNNPYPHDHWPESEGLTFEEVQQILLDTPDEGKAREWSQYYTSGPHLAGKNKSLALWTRDRWKSFGVNSEIVSYDVYLNYPVSHRLALLESIRESHITGEDGQAASNVKYKVKYECRLEEDVLDEDPTTALDDRIPTFNGYSATGNATAQYVYVNFGTYEDFEDLVKANVSLAGKIAIAKYGHVFRGLKVKRAQELGMAGVVIYSDPQEDGEVTEENGYKPYPEGPARNPSSVQRGSVSFLSIVPGDPTTPGWPSKPGSDRIDPESIPKIPSIPISYQDALPILKSLNGHGPKASDFYQGWRGGGLGYKGVKYNIGPSPPEITLSLSSEQDYVTTPLWDTIGVINGTIQDEVIILGNHRDAWIAGGAGDPNSGSAALNELVRSFGEALARGWKPLRTIVFASWDGEEHNLIGSTEWVEEYIPWLSKSAIAYLNVDVGTRGTEFTAAASPLLNQALLAATGSVHSPNQTVKGQTVRDLWSSKIQTMGSGSDFTAFQDFAGVPCINMGFIAAKNSPVYHYHSNYDSFAWMDTFGDPGWHYHITVTKLWALLAASLVETPIVALNVTDYADGLAVYLESVKTNATISPYPSINSLSAFPSLSAAIERLREVSIAFDSKAAGLARAIRAGVPWWRWWRRSQLYRDVRDVNLRYKLFERKFLYEQGLDGRSWFKHVVFAPGLWTGYAGATFPGLVENVDSGDEEGVKRWVKIIEQRIDAATASLK